MTSSRRKQLAALAVAIVFAVGACLLFPRVLVFAELAARELRYFWWLILILALGVWLAFFAGRRRD
jgi:hypothetical protein